LSTWPAFLSKVLLLVPVSVFAYSLQGVTATASKEENDAESEEEEEAVEEEQEKAHKELYQILLRKDMLQVKGDHGRLLQHLLKAISAGTTVWPPSQSQTQFYFH